MFIITYKKIFFAIALVLIVGSIVTMAIKGFNLGVDFTGGSMLDVSYDTRPSIALLNAAIKSIQPDAEIQYAGTNDVLIRTAPIDETAKTTIMTALTIQGAQPTEKSFDTIGPSVGRELRSKAILAVVLASLAIICFIAFAFREVSKPISSWVYGCTAVLGLIHNIIIPAGFFSLFHLQVDTLFVVGLLTIIGVSVHDTIVVFDRTRENLKINEAKKIHEEFSHTVGKSIKQTFTRSIMTSVTVLLSLAALYFFGPQSTQNLAIVMFLGMLFGAYSSIFLASPLLVVWNDRKMKKAGKK